MAVAAAAAFASLAILGSLADGAGLRYETLLQWRFGAAALVLALAGRLTVSLPARRRILLLGSGLIYTLQTSLFFAALGRITAGTTALLLYLAPLFIVLYSLALGRRPRRGQMVAVVLGVLGLAVIAGLPSPADADVLGLALAAAAGATYAGYLLAGEVVFAGIPPLVTTAHTVAGAALGFVALDLIRSGGLDLPAGSRQWWIVAGTVVIPTLIAIPLLFGAIGALGAGPAAVITNTEPLFTLAYAAALLGQAISPSQAVGGSLILAGAVVAQRSAARATGIVKVASG